MLLAANLARHAHIHLLFSCQISRSRDHDVSDEFVFCMPADIWTVFQASYLMTREHSAPLLMQSSQKSEAPEAVLRSWR